MSQKQTNSSSKTPTTIKIASKDANSQGIVGPGDPLAAPSVAPEMVDIPQPPTASQLVVKSTNSRKIKTINDPVSIPPAESSGQAETSQTATSQSGASQRATSQAVTSQAAPSQAGPSQTASSQSPASDTNSGAGASEHDEVEEGEGEVEHPPDSPSPGTGPTESEGPSDLQTGEPSGGVDSAPASSGGGSSKMSPKTSSLQTKSVKTTRSSAAIASSPSSGPSSASSSSSQPKASGKKKKVTKFRYHKRITVRTHGKTSPSVVMDKVNKKDHKAALTPSTIEDMDPQELMKRAGIKGNKKAHWRVRLRQTKRLTRNGKTVTETKVAYRDSEGNKRVKTVPGTDCKNCGKKLENCRCDEQ